MCVTRVVYLYEGHCRISETIEYLPPKPFVLDSSKLCYDSLSSSYISDQELFLLPVTCKLLLSVTLHCNTSGGTEPEG